MGANNKVTVEDVKIAAAVVAQEDRPTTARITEVVKEVARQRCEVEAQTGQ